LPKRPLVVSDFTKRLDSVSVAFISDIPFLGFKTPKEAIEGDFVDKKCPFTGNVAIRGRIFK
jgi:hypothetical protein